MAFTVEIMPSALKELQAIKVFYRREITQAIDEQLHHQATTPTRHRKILQVTDASFAFDPPLWELRIGDSRVFFDVDDAAKVVTVRPVRRNAPDQTTEDVLQ